ncbi:MAG: hypothetical protein L0206_16740, partial [Actinobacteria bacterium]|nr:hypothetical protein [Actinomycetota bacterium]
ELVVNDGAQPSSPDVVAVTAEVPIVSVDATDGAAAEPGGDPGIFTITRTGAFDAPLVVDYKIAGSATNGTDYATLGASVAFTSGQTTAMVTVDPIDDPLVEGDETVVLTLLDGTAYDLGAPTAATVTIADNPAPVVTIVATDANASEAGDGGAFTVSRTGSLTFPLVVSYTVTGTATNGIDYALLSTTVTIPDGAGSATIEVAPIDDGDFESAEGIVLQLSAGTDYLVGAPGVATVTIADDDTRVFASATDLVAAENGSDSGTWTISRLGPTTEPLLVSYTLSGTADAGVDYLALPGSVTIASGTAEVTVTLEPIDDALFEGPESAVLTLVDGPGYSVGAPGGGTITIQDDERPVVTVVASDSSANEAGLNPGVFTVSRTGPTGSDLTVFYSATGTATQGGDYEVLAGSVTIPSGSATATVTVVPIDDTLVEGAENVVLSLSADSAYVVVTPGIASVTIADDDLSVITVEATDPDATEAGLTPGAFTLRRTGDMAAALTVLVSRGGSASNGADYASIGGTNFAVTIAAGRASASVAILPLADNLVEDDETVVLTISPNLAYVVGTPDSATVVIGDDPAILTLSVSDPDAAEAGLDPGAFVITRSGGNVAAELTARFSLTGTAQNTDDYSLIGGTKVIPAGQTAVAVDVLPLPDNNVEGDQTVVLTLIPQAILTYLVGSPASGTVTIGDDPPVVTAAATDPDAAEAGLDPGTITFSRSGGNLGGSLIVFFTKGGTATNGTDYQSLGGAVSIVVIPASQPSAEVMIDPRADNLVEGPESAILTIAPSSGYTIGASATATVTIEDDPPVVTVSATDPDASEAGPDSGTFTFTRSGGNLAASLTVSFTRGGTATNTSDYANIGFSVTIPAGQAAATVTIAPVDDPTVEGAETVILTINASSSYVIGVPAAATVTIADND